MNENRNTVGILQLIVSYFVKNKMGILLFFLFGGIFLIVFWLYNLPLEPVLYAAILCICVGIIFLCAGFVQYYKRYMALRNLQNAVDMDLDALPASRDIIEQEYRDLIQNIHNHRIRIASEADIRRSEMVDYYTMWAHQIKTPIAAMHLLLQSEETEHNTELSMELFKIEQYVELVLQYLRLDSMSSDLVLKQHNLDDIVKQAIRKYAKVFIRKKISLVYTELNCKVLTDEKWLVFVIEQILSNALKYTPQGTISIYMDPSAEKTLVIEDTGIGIKPEDLPRIFEKGFTGYNGRLDKKSTGIGLYLCSRILAKLSHTITIESQVGKGTKVLINLATVQMVVE